jgi:predicted acyl esterase
MIEFALPDVCHCFRKGHKIMVHVQSSWFPIVDRNPQTFCNSEYRQSCPL